MRDTNSDLVKNRSRIHGIVQQLRKEDDGIIDLRELSNHAKQSDANKTISAPCLSSLIGEVQMRQPLQQVAETLLCGCGNGGR